MLIFAFFFIPQIFFYGVSSLAGGVLNARGHFAAPMWTPVLNNIVVIGVLLLFMASGGIGVTLGTITPAQVQLLGWGTTLGIIVQTLALIPVLRRVGFRWRPRWDFRRSEVSEIGRMAGPLFGYIVTTQIAFLVVSNVANKASVHAPLRRSLHLWLRLAAVPDAVCDRRHLGDHGAVAQDERARGGAQVFAGEGRLLQRESGSRRPSWYPPRCVWRSLAPRWPRPCSATAAPRWRRRATSAWSSASSRWAWCRT